MYFYVDNSFYFLYVCHFFGNIFVYISVFVFFYSITVVYTNIWHNGVKDNAGTHYLFDINIAYQLITVRTYLNGILMGETRSGIYDILYLSLPTSDTAVIEYNVRSSSRCILTCFNHIVHAHFYRFFVSRLPSFGLRGEKYNQISLSDNTVIEVVFVDSDVFFYNPKARIFTGIFLLLALLTVSGYMYHVHSEVLLTIEREEAARIDNIRQSIIDENFETAYIGMAKLYWLYVRECFLFSIHPTWPGGMLSQGFANWVNAFYFNYHFAKEQSQSPESVVLELPTNEYLERYGINPYHLLFVRYFFKIMYDLPDPSDDDDPYI